MLKSKKGSLLSAKRLERKFQAAIEGAAGFVVRRGAAVIGAAVQAFVKQIVDAQAHIQVFIETVTGADADQTVGFDFFVGQTIIFLNII